MSANQLARGVNFLEMASIGPQLPPHLQKRATASDPDSDDTEHEPKGPYSASTSIGPQIPTNLLANRARHAQGQVLEDEDDEENDSFGPALPPELMASRGSNTASVEPASVSKRTVGPTLPGHDRLNDSDDDKDDDDDDYGPMPMPAEATEADRVNEGVREFLEKEEKRRKEIEVCIAGPPFTGLNMTFLSFRKLLSQSSQNGKNGCLSLLHRQTSSDVSSFFNNPR